MTVPASSHPIWKDVLNGKIKHDFQFLALKMMLGRIQITLKADPSQAQYAKCVEDLRNLLMQNANHPKVQNDLSMLLSNGGLS
jgi:hypothetical protein